MEQQKISVIVPVYKVEPFLDRCVQSIVGQTYRNLEVILVDDGSPDNCSSLCDAWAAEDNRVKVIHKVNGGLSDARNAGIAVATGELMGFVDGDDWIAPDMYQHLHDLMMTDHSDIAACGVEMVWEDGTSSRMFTKSGNCVLNREEAMRSIIEESWLKQPVWYKLYKTALIMDIPFPVGKYHEDVFWSYQAVAKAERVSVSDQVGYYYLQRNGSIMGEEYSLKRLDVVEAKRQRLTFVQEAFPQFATTAQLDLFFTCLYHGQLSEKYLSHETQKKAFRILKDTIGVCPRLKQSDMNNISFTHRCWIRIANLSVPFACWLRNKIRIGI